MSLRERIGHVIFETDTPVARAFDVVLLWAILVSVLLVVLETVAQIRAVAGEALRIAEWTFTGLFTAEYLLRIYAAERRRSYVTSFFGIIDFVAILPTYLSLFLLGTPYFAILRALRLLRVFRVFKLSRHLGAAGVLMTALRASREKITVFLVAVLTLVLIVGALMYVVEGPEYGFSNIPIGVYWAIVTLTTVGYGDVVPQTALGKALAGLVMILGYGVIAVPTGIVTTEMSRISADASEERPCPSCGTKMHEPDAVFCRRCGTEL